MVIDYGGLKRIFDQLPCGLLLAGDDGEILLFNDKAPVFLEADPIDLLEKGIATVPTWCGLAESVRSIGIAEHARQSVEFTRGRKRFVLTVARDGISLFGKDCLVAIIEDVTRQKELEELRTGFFFEFLKRIRGPLTSVKTALSVLSSEKFSSQDEESREIAILGYDEVQRMHSLMSDMSDLFALDTHTASTDIYLENVDVRTILNRCQRRALKSPRGLNREIAVRFPESETPSRVVADYEKLGLVLNHLIDNALTYSARTAPVCISAVETGGSIEFRITDSGFGISPEDLPKVFNRFFRSSHPDVVATEGGGLGLFLARGFSEIMGGALTLQSGPGGTTAILTLPLAHAVGMAE